MERRLEPRHFLVLGVEIIDEKSHTKAKARTTDVSRSGCYLDTLNPFPAGTIIKIRMVHDGVAFEARARVVHQAPGMGMGVCFVEPDAANQAVLDSWLAAAPLAVS
ncbi:MAG TPA: PilZ domain-containing protein [Methylomirabilota bacterium]|jgi:hypothetical protein|nr:PilZ domain-containing protein [Methylomirabilota bacterium]